MYQCLHCGKDTNNPKFCSRSCSVSYNNKTTKRKHSQQQCPNCSKSIESRATYCSMQCCHEHKRKLRFREIEKVQAVNVRDPRRWAKLYLFHIYGDRCQICGIETWQSKPIIKILDHIDGNADNWKLSNLRLVCSNCDSQLPTYKSKNRGNGRHLRRQRYAEGQSY